MHTRKHPRTLADAFPRTAEYAAALERPSRSSLRPMQIVKTAAALFAIYAVLVIWRQA